MGREPGTQLCSRRSKLEPGTRSAFSRRLWRPVSQSTGQRRRQRLCPCSRMEPGPHRVSGTGAFLGRAVLEVFRSGTFRRPTASGKTSRRAPPGGITRTFLPATMEASGVPSAGSQPPNQPPSRPRRWDDAGPPPADQKAGYPGSIQPVGGSFRARLSGHDHRVSAPVMPCLEIWRSDFAGTAKKTRRH